MLFAARFLEQLHDNSRKIRVDGRQFSIYIAPVGSDQGVLLAYEGGLVRVVDGIYEWRKDGARKTPFFVHLRSSDPFGLAGIWCLQRATEGTPIVTCAILTCGANELMAQIHNRMPVILLPGVRERWLDANTDPGDLRGMLKPLPSEELDAYPVSPFVNSPRHDSPECIRRVGA